ncbi:PD-(D/E)XK nuclease family protein [Cellvibrio sp. OA-2007]|uniref:PD-(D/E)XK nuclease family protein n=1 Tax=Cellvibrio sp. OA-2007 TaxID=529823 RepID=UPI0007837E7D|nr:PD-(D/E)XK nuclease family protein [Cellvibrio sp. OA-2007]
MVDTYFDITPYLAAIDSGELIITANNRLRNHMLRAYGQRQTDTSNVWPSPRIYSLSQWLELNWALLQRRAYTPAAQRIINNLQRQTLWEKIIGESSLAAALLQPEPLAQAADSALRNLELWQLTEEQVRAAEPLLNTQSNTYCWLTWLGEFRARLAQLGFITQESANQILIDAFKQSQLKQESIIHLTGFDDIPPQHQDLINSACQQLRNIKLENQTTQLMRTETQNNEAEIRAAALWSKQQLEQNPAAMIGIIVPNLGQCRDQVERIFVEVFEPLAALPNQPRYTLPFNFSAGTPLGATPIISATLDLLELQKSSWDLEAICNLLLSPFFGDSDAELVLRTHLVQTLRKLSRFTISLSDLRYHGQKLASKLGIAEGDSNLISRLVQLENYRRQSFGKQSAQYWSDFFQQHLQLLGWPGTRRLDSQEYQQLTLWNQVLENFLQLDGTGIELTYTAAIQQLRSIAGKTPFQAQTPNSPIQILGALEGAGLQFSHCWVMGLHHRQWPPVPAPNPLLPSNLQRTQKMPHASAERELQFARALTEHYGQCAPVVIFSSAHSDDESELSPSALIRHLPLTAIETLIGNHDSVSAHNYQVLAATRHLEIVPTAQAPQLILGQEPVRGGASLFKEQGACPFNAFARLRLGANSIDEPVAGFSAIERGNLLHDALAQIWKQLKDQQTLLALDESALNTLINQTTQTAVDALKQKRGTSIGAFYAQLEQERLAQLITEWLAQEKTRPPFTVVAIEEEVQLEFAGLPLRLRIDRIDQLDNGDLILIDYKTGQPKLQSWQGERMDEPQLPLYAVTASNKIAAMAFAQINAKAMKWIGTGELNIQHDGIFPSKTPWDEQLQEWQLFLQNLAADFIQGDARVDMKNSTTAQYAEDLLPLNRLQEQDALNAFVRGMQGAV